jgi:hypothetical protein
MQATFGGVIFAVQMAGCLSVRHQFVTGRLTLPLPTCDTVNAWNTGWDR